MEEVAQTGDAVKVEAAVKAEEPVKIEAAVEAEEPAKTNDVSTTEKEDDMKVETDPKPTDDNDKYSLKVKPEYVLTGRSSVLAPLKPPPEIPEDLRDNGQGKGKKSKKKRPRDARQDSSEKLCMAFIRGLACPFGKNCKYSHDLKAFMATREPDLPMEGGCPNYNAHGFCIYGAMCRFGSSHINGATGENITKSDRPDDEPLPDPTASLLPKDIQTQLRKKKYPFKCKRHGNKSFGEPLPKTESTGLSNSTPVELKTRKIIDFSNKVYIAPLTTVGNLPFRRIMKKFQADITCGEMALSSCILEGKASEWALMKRHKDEDIFGVQVASAHADQFTRAAELIEKYVDVDFVDLNMGCPIDLVCNKGAGAALMMRDKKLKGILEGITNTLTCPITIKMRTGWDMSKPFAHVLVPKIQGWNEGNSIAAVMIHGRSRLQRYSKDANWDYIGQVASNLSPEYQKIPIIGNGDIFSYTDYEEKVAREGVNATAMLARGALIKPWLPTEIKERRHWDISATERLDILKDYVRFGLEHWGSDQQGVNNTRRFLLEWLSFLHRYVPVGLLEVIPQQMSQRPPKFMCGRSDLETLFMSGCCEDWIKISEMLLGKAPDDFQFEPKHKAKGYA